MIVSADVVGSPSPSSPSGHAAFTTMTYSSLEMLAKLGAVLVIGADSAAANVVPALYPLRKYLPTVQDSSSATTGLVPPVTSCVPYVSPAESGIVLAAY